MWLVKELWFHRHQHSLSIIANAVAMFLVLLVSVACSNVTTMISEQLNELGLDVTMLQIYDNSLVEREWFEAFQQEYSIKGSPYYCYQAGSQQLVGCNGQLADLFHLKMAKGSFFSDLDVLYNNNVIVMGHDAYEEYGYVAIGDEVLFQGVSFRLVGVLKKDQSNLFADLDNACLVPWGYCLKNYDGQLNYYFTYGENYLEGYLEEALGKDNYLLVDQEDLAGSMAVVLKGVRSVLMFLAVMALAVAFIGLINNANASIKERKNEIGIKKAYGASQKDIYLQFMLETVTVLLIALLLAVISLWVLCFLFSHLLNVEISYGLKDNAALLGRIIFCGSLCGLYPAYKASKTTVIESISREIP